MPDRDVGSFEKFLGSYAGVGSVADYYLTVYATLHHQSVDSEELKVPFGTEPVRPVAFSVSVWADKINLYTAER